jgi:nucleotide-binding universal stress UspA family protein
MKTIIVPTDFSETAENALHYAIELAKLMGATITLIHVCQLHGTKNYLNEQDLEQKKQKALKLLENHIKTNNNVNFEICVRPQYVVNKIVDTAREKNAELIVFGISAGIYDESIVGNNTSDAISNLHIPVLMIPSGVTFKIPSKIVFAADYLELENNRPLTALLNFISFFGSKLFIVNVKAENEKTSSRNIAVLLNVRKLLKKVNHSVHHVVHENVVDGINDFVSDKNAEIVAIIPHRHNLVYRLFKFSTTKKMAYNSSVPLLALPEGIKLPVFESQEPVAIPEQIFEKEIQWFKEQFAI